MPIKKWFWAAYLVSTLTPGISAIQLQRQIGLGSYRTAWYMLSRLRKGMVNEERRKLSGTVEADETIVGGPAKGKRGRGVTRDTHKSLILGAVEVISYTDKNGKRKKRAGRIRLTTAKHADEKNIGRFLQENIEARTNIRTDGWTGYSKTALTPFSHRPTVQETPERASRLAPHIHRAFSNLKTWLMGTHHGVGQKYLQTYLDEYVFRFNRRNTPMAAFETLLGITVKKPPMPLETIKSVDSSA